MSRFAHLRSADIDFINQHRELILKMINELFEDGVIGKREWEIVDSDTYIALRLKPEEKGEEYEYVFFRREDVDNTEVLRIKHYGTSSRCYLDEEDIGIGLTRIFSKKKYEAQTEYEKDVADGKAKSEQERKEQFLLEYGSLMKKDVIQSAMSGLKDKWELRTDNYRELMYFSQKKRETHRFKYKTIEVKSRLSFNVSQSKSCLLVELNCEYKGFVEIAALSSQNHLGSQSFYRELKNLTKLSEALESLLDEQSRFEKERF